MKKVLNFDKTKFYPIIEAIELVKTNSKTKFVSSIDIAIKLNLDTAKTEQQLRGTLSLPYFFGKKKKILVLDSNLTKNDAKLLDVDFAGGKDLIDEISKGWLAFDLIITTPKMMPELSKLGKILGTRGLMPSPKNGNVTTNIKKTIQDFKSGITQYRTDSYGNIHILVGKTNADSKHIEENINFIIDFLKSKKPSVVKGIYIQNVSISSTMGPGVKISIQKNIDSDKKSKSKSKQKIKVLTKNKVIKPIIKIVYENKKDALIRNEKLLSASLVKENSPSKNVKKIPKIQTIKKVVSVQKTVSKGSDIKNNNISSSPIIKSGDKVKTLPSKTVKSVKLPKPVKPIKPILTKDSSIKKITPKTIEKKVFNKKNTKEVIKKEVLSKKIVSKTVEKKDSDKKVTPKTVEKKVNDKKVSTNKKITKEVIKKEILSKKVAPRKVEIKKPSKTK